jgi:EcsC protein family
MNAEITEIEFTASDLQDLRFAKTKLETHNLVAQIADLVSKPTQALLKRLPKQWNAMIGKATQSALFKGLEFVILTMGNTQPKQSRDRLHKVLVTTSGMIGGAAGLTSSLIELPVSTCLVLRSIADIARSEGHDIARPEIKLACLEVLALSGKSDTDEVLGEGYWAVRGFLAKSVSEAAAYITEKGLVEEGAPPLAKLIAKIAARFSTVVTEELAAKAVPVVGAVAGGTINLLFMQHFQAMATGHFIVKRLEAKYGTERVERMYAECDLSSQKDYLAHPF